MKGIRKLRGLYPPFREQIRCLLKLCIYSGYNVGVYSTLRTFEEQERLWQKGRSASGEIVTEELVVTRARPGTSWHNYGLAADIVFYPWNWDYEKLNYKEVGHLGKIIGLSWGGDFRKPDMPHFFNSFGMSINQAKRLYEQGGLASVWGGIEL